MTVRLHGSAWQRAGPVAAYDAVARAALKDVSALKAAGRIEPNLGHAPRNGRNGTTGHPGNTHPSRALSRVSGSAQG
jgi:hypothetical protein